MPRLIWSPAALRDLTDLYRFLRSKNPDAAKRAVKTIKTIREGMRHVADHPQVGRPVEDMATEFREWLIDFGSDGYITLYRYEGGTAVILTVRHVKEAGY